jgi:sporulation protein YlmC with PRC-barrel domain
MSETMEFDIGSEVDCTDGVCGKLSRLVVDPVAQSITHIVVDPGSRHAIVRLVPIRFVASAGERVNLTCTKAQFEVFEEADETDFVRIPTDWAGYEADHVLSWPYYGLHASGMGVVSRASMGPLSETTPTELTTYDNVPLGEVEVRRGDDVHATDGTIGRVHGLVIDPQNYHVTHFLLEEGHLWGHKTVAIPISAVIHAGDGVRLNLTKDQVRDLPPVDVEHHVR